MSIKRIVVLGDSVGWGQGLLPAHKYAQLLALELPANPPPTVEILAHSGAIIDTLGTLGNQASQCNQFSGEIPVAGPSVRAQARAVTTPSTVDLLLVNGGINDVDLTRILSPFTRTEDLARYIQDACYGGMKTLLTEIAETFSNPAIKVVITGYYPILSPDSDQSSFEDLLSIFGVSLPGQLDADLILPEVTKRCMQFWQQSDAAFLQAVRETSAATGLGANLVFVPSPLGATNALFASSPWLFGLANGINPEDEVIEARRVACDSCYQETFNLLQFSQCCIASVGHPNVLGATAFAEAIRKALIPF
jgi:lysophospholipase L1-like esterase